MIYKSANEFYKCAKLIKRLTEEEEKELAKRKKSGDLAAREKLIEGYLPVMASIIGRYNKESLELIMMAKAELEKQVDRFDFFGGSDSFTHVLSLAMRQVATRYIANKSE